MTSLRGSMTSLATLNVGWCLLAAGTTLTVALLILGDPRTRFLRGRRIRRRDRPAIWRQVVGALMVAVSLVVLAAGSGLWWVRRDLIGNISTVALDHPSQPDEDRTESIWERYPHGRNLLLLGSDTRAGMGNQFGNVDGARSDTALLVHLGGDGKWISGVSIPRDTVMDLPLTRRACGHQASDRRDRFNAAFDAGGPACTVSAVERLTGIEVDNVLVVDFAGFEKIVNALGGLTVCLRHPLYDKKALLDLPAGTKKVRGADALALMRARHAFGNGSDIGRTARQQYLVTQLVSQVRARGLLSNPARLYRIASAATRSLTTDESLGNVQALLDLGDEISGVTEKRIHLTTLPWLPDPQNPNNTVVIDEEKARPFLDAMARDEEPGVRHTSPTQRPSATSGSEQPTTTTTRAVPRTTTTTTTTDPTVTDTFCDVDG